MNKSGSILILYRRYVVSAANCQSADHPIVEVVIGQTDLSKDPECEECAPAQKFNITIEDVVIHKDWDKNSVVTEANDILLIRLPELAMTFNEDKKYRVMPVCLKYKDVIE